MWLPDGVLGEPDCRGGSRWRSRPGASGIWGRHRLGLLRTRRDGFSRQWRGGLAVAAALVGLVVGMWALAPAPVEGHKVVVTDPQGRTLWEIAARGEALRVRTVRDPGMAPERQCRLWLRWPDSGGYQPVAVLAEEPGRHRMALPERLHGRLEDSRVLVSVTPSGRPAGQRPEGEVIFRGPWAPSG